MVVAVSIKELFYLEMILQATIRLTRTHSILFQPTAAYKTSDSADLLQRAKCLSFSRKNIKRRRLCLPVTLSIMTARCTHFLFYFFSHLSVPQFFTHTHTQSLCSSFSLYMIAASFLFTSLRHLPTIFTPALKRTAHPH